MLKAEKVERLNAIMRFSIYDQRSIEKAKRVEIAKRCTVNSIADVIFKEFEDLPIEFLEKEIDQFDGSEEYRLTMHIVERKYLKEIQCQAEIGRYIEKLYTANGNTEYLEKLKAWAEKDKTKKVEWQEVRKPYEKFATCPRCGGDENLYGEDSIRNDFCGRCGQRLEW